MSEELKNSRKARKSALTREVNTTLKFVEGGIKDEVEKRLEKIKSKFTAFEEAHEVFHITLIDEADISESDNYFDDVQSNYISTLQRIDAMLRKTKHVTAEGAVKDDKKMGNESKAMVNESPATTDNSNVTKELVSLINLPRLEIQPYEGDPLKFHNFFVTFDEAIDRGTQDPGVKLTRLLQYTQGRANAAIASCAVIGGEAGYKKARDTLKSRFGNHHLISDTVIKQLKSGCPVKSPDELLLLSDELNNCMTVLENLGKLHEVDTQSSIVHIVDRLQPYLRNRWRNDAMKVKREKDVYPSFEDLVEFVSKAAEDASDPVYGQQGRTSTKPQPEKFKKSSVSFSTGAEKKSLQKYPRPTCILCGESHRLFYCQTFKNMKPVERLKLVRERKLCENCLLSNHVVEDCRKLSVCSVPGCGLRHTKFIHIEPSDMFRGSGRSAVVPEVSSNQVKVTNNGEQLKCATFIPIVPVMVNNKQEVSALLDTASNSSFCTRSLIDELGIQGKSVKYILNTMSKSQESRSSCIVNFALKSKDGKNSLQLSNVYVVDNIPVKIPCIDWSKYPHLQDLPIGDCPEVHILIGQDNSEALVPMEVRRGQHGDPFAVRTLFGWSLNGPALTTGPVSRRVINHFISSTVEDEVNKLWNLENEGCDRHSPQLSHIDREVMESWDNRVTLVDGHYKVPIPWKKDVHVPNNVNVAQARLKSLCVNLKKLNLYEKYNAEIRVLLDKCYAEPVPLYDVNVSQIWYLPHHCVTNDNKPGKIRVVFDCSSRFEGESLNDKCNQGPEMNNKLVHVLLRFREHEVAIMADIEAMYHQVLVPVVDRDALRFLWYDNTGQAMHYRMTRHVFGGVWSGSVATYALRRTVADYDGYDSLIDDTVLKSFYVDDCLRSVMSEKEAVQIIKGTKSLLQMSGFKLTKFVSNNMHVLENVTECDRAKECENLTSGFNSRALGVKWNFLSDEFKFDLCIENKENITRRNMHPLDDIIEHYSSWTKIRRAVAWLLRLKEFLRSKKKAKLCLMSVSEIKTAENLIFKHVQGQIYEKEIKKLNSGSSVDKSSSVSDLSPVVDENGLLCVGGRLNYANLSQSRKHPCIVPHKHPIALKIVSEIHEDGHPGTEWTLSLLRAKYWVTNARSVIKNIRHKCIMCKRLNASPCVQQMANLPAERLQPDQPPFTYVGVDYFGPFMVKFGRGEAKKYGCIYTCLTTRAIHLEKIDSLDTDSFLNGFRRFIARRGLPRKVWSDNGTNFVGGLSELKKGLRELQQYKVHNYCLSKEIDWIFNHPHSSHMGGVWERLIRTVRKVFTSMLMDSKQRLTDEVLRTLFCEVESIINNRPITKVNSDATDNSPLTPNHLLLLSEGPKPPLGLFSRGDMFHRRWRYVQHLADQF